MLIEVMDKDIGEVLLNMKYVIEIQLGCDSVTFTTVNKTYTEEFAKEEFAEARYDRIHKAMVTEIS